MIGRQVIWLLVSAWSAGTISGFALPKGFVYLDEVDPTIEVELRYATSRNFVGKKVDGYEASRAIMTRAAAEALSKVQKDLREQGYGLKVLDAYRPQRAVNHFVRWGRDLKDEKTKAEYFPEVPKSQLFRRGYISMRSGHSRGSTVDLTLVKLQDKGNESTQVNGEEAGESEPVVREKQAAGKEVDMGTRFDFFDQKSWPYSDQVTAEQKKNRMLLRNSMKKWNFRPYDREWWHFTLNGEPFPRTYFDFPVE